MSRQLRHLALLSGLTLLLVVTGCAQVKDFFVEDDICIRNEMLFSDDFNNENECGWALFDSAGAKADIIDETLHLEVSTQGQVAWSNPGRTFTDVAIAVTSEQIKGTDDNTYGVICRYVDSENFYLFLISGDGYYAIAKYQSGIDQAVYLTGESPYFFQPSDAINKGDSVNQWRVQCLDDTLSLSVNGLQLASVEDSTFTEGDVGLIAGTFESDAIEIAFENLRVSAP